MRGSRLQRSRWRWAGLVAAGTLALLLQLSRVPAQVHAQTPPPGPQLATGTHTDPSVSLLRGSWEAFPAANSLGHMLLIWDSADLVSRALPCAASSPGMVCYAWVQYFYDSDDFYDTGQWIPFQRGCTVLGANPVEAATATGFSAVTDLWAGDWVPLGWEPFPDAYLNPLGTGTGAVTDPNAVFTACTGGPTTPPTTPSTGCSQYVVSGSWHATQANDYSPTFTFSQAGTSLSGTASLPANEQARASFRSPTGAIAGSLVGNALDFTVTWQGVTGPIVGRYTGTVVPGASAGSGEIRNGLAGAPTGSRITPWSGSGPLACATAGPTPAPTAPTVCSWSGTWQSASWPTMVLTQSGMQVSGTYGSQGRVAGTVAGDTLTGTVTDGAGTVSPLKLRIGIKTDFTTGEQRPAISGCQFMSGTIGRLPADFTQ